MKQNDVNEEVKEQELRSLEESNYNDFMFKMMESKIVFPVTDRKYVKDATINLNDGRYFHLIDNSTLDHIEYVFFNKENYDEICDNDFKCDKDWHSFPNQVCQRKYFKDAIINLKDGGQITLKDNCVLNEIEHLVLVEENYEKKISEDSIENWKMIGLDDELLLDCIVENGY